MEFAPDRATFSASAFDQLAAENSLQRYGCALVKGLFDPAELATFDARIMRNLEGIPEDQQGNGLPLYFAGKDSKATVQAAFRRSYPAIFAPRKMRRFFLWPLDCASLSGFVLTRLRETGIRPVLEKLLRVPRLYSSASICHIRHFPAVEREQIREAERGLEFHQDNRLYKIGAEIFTLWFPFRYEHGTMASLEFLPRSEKALLPTLTACGIDRDAYPKSAFWSPAYELGDAMILSGYAPHRTYYPPAVSKGRTSIDFRFFPSRVPAPIYGD